MGIFAPCNVYDEAWLVLVFMKILGLYPAGCCSTPGTGYVYVVLFLLIYNVLFIGMRDYTIQDLAMLELAMGIAKIRKLRFILNTILLHLIVISTSYCSPKIKRAFKEIDKVDKGLKYLNIPMDHTLSMKRNVVRILNTVLFVLVLNLMEYYSLWTYDRDYVYVLMWIIDRIPDFVCCILLCSYGVLAAKLSLRYAKIARALEMIVERKNYLAIYKSIDNNSAFRWKFLKFLSMRLGKSIGLINQAYGFQFTLLSGLYFIFACLHLSIVYTNIFTVQTPADVVVSSFWGAFDIAKFLYIINSYLLVKQNA